MNQPQLKLTMIHPKKSRSSQYITVQEIHEKGKWTAQVPTKTWQIKLSYPRSGLRMNQAAKEKTMKKRKKMKTKSKRWKLTTTRKKIKMMTARKFKILRTYKKMDSVVVLFSYLRMKKTNRNPICQCLMCSRKKKRTRSSKRVQTKVAKTLMNQKLISHWARVRHFH